MKELTTLWSEKKYREFSQRCHALLEKEPENGQLRCLYAGGQAAVCTLMQPTLSQAAETFQTGFEQLKRQGDSAATAQALTQFCEALDVALASVLALFVPVCKYEASIDELRGCMEQLLDTVEQTAGLYTLGMVADEHFHSSYCSLCMLGMQAVTESCAIRGIEKVTAKKTFISVSYIQDDVRQPLIKRYDSLVQRVRHVRPDFAPVALPERQQPSAEAIQQTAADFRKYLYGEDAPSAAPQAPAESEASEEAPKNPPKKGGFFRKLFGKNS